MTHRQLVPLLLLLACTNLPTDTDEDLLSDALEAELGTNPENPDSDGDGLLDGLEVHAHLTDPTQADSDGDADEDGWELEVGLDPLDASSKRYPNGWPHLGVATKRELQREPAPALVTPGQRVDNLVLRHPEATRVELYDFARDGRPIVLIDVGRSALSDFVGWIELGAPSIERIGPPPTAFYDAIVNGTVRVIFSWPEYTTGEPTSDDDLINGFGNRDIPDDVAILIDRNFSVWAHLGRRGLGLEDPSDRSKLYSFVLLDQDMVVLAINDWDAVVAALP
jgi:hypothetical protein